MLDAAAVLAVIAGPDGRDQIGLHVEMPDPRSELDLDIEGLKLAWTDDFGFAMDYAVDESPRVIRCIREAAFALNSLGATVEPTYEQWEDYAIVTRANFAAPGWRAWGSRGAASPTTSPERDRAAPPPSAGCGSGSCLPTTTSCSVRLPHVAPTIRFFATRIPSGRSIDRGWPGPGSCWSTPGSSTCSSFLRRQYHAASSTVCPFGLQIVGFSGRDPKVLRLAHAFRRAFPHDQRPPATLDQDRSREHVTLVTLLTGWPRRHHYWWRHRDRTQHSSGARGARCRCSTSGTTA